MDQYLYFSSGLLLAHFILSRYNVKGKYFLLHSMFNGWIVSNIYEDFINTFFNPLEPYPVPYSINIYVIIFHIYHTLFYRLTFDDVLHHIINVFVVCSIIYHNCTNLNNFGLFFLTGFPGFLIYPTLFLKENNLITKKVEKWVSKNVNMWIRAPGCVITAYLVFINFIIPTYTYKMYPELAGSIFICVATLWNGLYFLQTITISQYRTGL